MTRLHLLSVTALLGLALGTTALAAPSWLGSEKHDNGILAVHNPAAPVETEVTVLQPAPLWRIGGEDDPAETMFGLVTDAQPLADGSTWVLDAVMSTLYHVSPEGEIMQTLGREGDGPGEFRNANSLGLLPDGSVGVVEMMPSQMVVFGPDGLPRPTIALAASEGGRPMVQRLAVLDDSMVMGFFGMKFDHGSAEITRMLGVFDLNGGLRHAVLSESETQSGGSISISSGGGEDFVANWAASADGRVYVHRTPDSYAIEVFGPDGKPERLITREYASVRRPDAEIQAQKEQQEEMRQRFEGNAAMEIEEYARDIDRVIPRPDGSIWVLSSRGNQAAGPGVIGVFDELDADGRFVRQVRLEADFDPDDDQFLVRGDRLYVLKEALNAPDRTFSGGGGMMMIQMSSGGGSDDDEEEEDLAPYEVICYELR